MPFIPHTPEDVSAMLDAIGAKSIDELFEEIPAQLRKSSLNTVPTHLSEMETGRLMEQRAAQDAKPLCFIGAGAYEHHIPAAVWELTTRGEFYSAYTPYQAEASQGTLQLLYEFQTMMTQLTGMEVSNASLYDGASALAESVLMAVRTHGTSRRVLMPSTVHPTYRAVVRSIVQHQHIELVELAYCTDDGYTVPDSLQQFKPDEFAALVIPQPNFFGVLEEVDALTDWAHKSNILVIAVVNPISLALLKPPGVRGETGADIVCGEGQPLGAPLSSGGPYFGFMCCKKKYVRQMPGRIIGSTVDLDGKPGYALTLQAREQHIRRSKATSNICTNQGLLVTAATIHMALLGPEGLERVAAQSHANTQRLVDMLCAIPGVSRVFQRPTFHETALRFDKPAQDILQALATDNILGGYDLSAHYPELDQAVLVCVTETKLDTDLDAYATSLQRILTQ